MSESSSESIQLLRRIAELLDRDRLGLIDDPPGRRTIYAHRNADSLWHFWDKQAEQRVPIDKTAVRGHLTDLFLYVKESPEGSSTKVRACLSCHAAEYEIETSLHATSGRGLMSGLLEAGDAVAERPVTIGVRPADKEAVLFVDVYTDEGGLQISENHIPQGDTDAAISAVQSVRRALSLDPDPWTSRFDHAGEPSESAHESGTPRNQPPPRGQQPDRSDSAASSSPGSATHSQQDAQKDFKRREAIEVRNGMDPPSLEDPTAETISEADAVLLWNAAKMEYDIQEFLDMVTEAFQVGHPEELSPDDWARAWQFACDRQTWERTDQFEPDDELPF